MKWLWVLPLDIQWGTVGEWVGGIGTAGALILAFIIMITDRRSRKRDQVTQIFFWEQVRDIGTDDGPRTLHRFYLRNGSQAPIHAPILYVRSRTRFEHIKTYWRKPWRWFEKLFPRFGYNMHFKTLGEFVEPGQSCYVDVPPVRDLYKGQLPHQAICFGDVRNRWWMTDSTRLRVGQRWLRREMDLNGKMIVEHLASQRGWTVKEYKEHEKRPRLAPAIAEPEHEEDSG